MAGHQEQCTALGRRFSCFGCFWIVSLASPAFAANLVAVVSRYHMSKLLEHRGAIAWNHSLSTTFTILFIMPEFWVWNVCTHNLPSHIPGIEHSFLRTIRQHNACKILSVLYRVQWMRGFWTQPRHFHFSFLSKFHPYTSNKTKYSRTELTIPERLCNMPQNCVSFFWLLSSHQQEHRRFRISRNLLLEFPLRVVQWSEHAMWT